VSISDVAKILLESAREDRLDFRLEVAELQDAGTESLSAMRKKWEHLHEFSRAEWIFLAQYIQVACEQPSGNPRMPAASTLAVLLEALLAVRALRTDRGAGLDRYYLGNLGVPDDAILNERQMDPQLVPQVVASLILGLREPSNVRKPTLAGRSFYVALRDEMLHDLVALNHTLVPYLPTLFRLAARGHWIRERRPLRPASQGPVYSTPMPSAGSGNLRMNSSLTSEGDLQIELLMESRGVSYPLGSYPEIREFHAMLEQVELGRSWDGMYFHAVAESLTGIESRLFRFRRVTDGIRFTFLEEEWHSLKSLLDTTLAEPLMQPVLDELSLVYGEV
jgi:hypothetical protein